MIRSLFFQVSPRKQWRTWLVSFYLITKTCPTTLKISQKLLMKSMHGLYITYILRIVEIAMIRSLSTSRQTKARIHAKIRKQELVVFYCRKTILLAIQRAWVQAIRFKHDTRYTCKIPIYIVEFCTRLFEQDWQSFF